jgi:hypothetical protein
MTVYDIIDVSIQKMMSDGKIDSSDIPELVMLITKLSAEDTVVPSSTEDLGRRIDEMYVFLMNKYDLYPKDMNERLLFDKLFRSSVRLVLYQPVIKSKCDNFWSGLCRN